MGWLLLIVIETLGPVGDWLESTFQSTEPMRFVGSLVVQGNIETGDSDIKQLLLLKSGQKLSNWRVPASEWLLLFVHGDKFDLKSKQLPQVALSTPADDSKFYDLVVTFPEKATGFRVEQDRFDKECEKVVIQFLKALQAKDQTEAGKIIEVPWLADKERVLHTVPEVTGQIESVIAQSPKYDAFIAKSPLVHRYSELRPELKRQEVRKLLDEVLGRDGRIISLTTAGPSLGWRIILVRFDKGKPCVVGGPYKATYLLIDNTFPPSAKQALENATTFELLSLNPVSNTEKEKSGFYGFAVLGKTQLKEAGIRKQVVAAFQQAIDESEGLAAACFNPRHGFRVTHEKKTFEFVICYECMQIAIYEDGKPLKRVFTTGSAQDVLDRVLRDAGVPLAKKSK